jgi:type III secretion protein L
MSREANKNQAVLRFLPEGSIISAADLETTQQAEAYRAWSLSCLETAQAAADRLRERAAAEGYVDGVSQGRHDAVAALAAVAAQVRDDLAALRPSLAPIVLKAVEKLVGTLDRAELVRGCLDAALAEIAATIEVTLYVPPQDLDFFRTQVQALGEPTDAPIRLVVDPLLKPGEMMLGTPNGRTHIGPRQQITRLAAVLGGEGAP